MTSANTSSFVYLEPFINFLHNFPQAVVAPGCISLKMTRSAPQQDDEESCCEDGTDVRAHLQAEKFFDFWGGLEFTFCPAKFCKFNVLLFCIIIVHRHDKQSL